MIIYLSFNFLPFICTSYSRFFFFFRFARSTSDNYNYQLIASRVSTVVGLLLVAGVTVHVVTGRVGVQSQKEIQARAMVMKANGVKSISADCHSAVSLGAYFSLFCHFISD